MEAISPSTWAYAAVGVGCLLYSVITMVLEARKRRERELKRLTDDIEFLRDRVHRLELDLHRVEMRNLYSAGARQR
ncbi:hypothetical protein [Gryllotalpicola koreensis]|uniref:Uncharacterized protein n=1 Tax=Gryllotalpicola koreensis TaxID=993086 RepID=A0ABP8A7Z8_9MICO